MSDATTPSLASSQFSRVGRIVEMLVPRGRFRSVAWIVALTLALFCRGRQGDAIQVFVQVGQIQIQRNVLVSWVFNNNRGSIDEVRQQLDEIIQTRIDLIVSACDLTPHQRTQLEMAGAGDIHRFFNEYESLSRTMPVGNVSQQEYQELWQKIQPLRQKFASGLHTRDSLFSKSILYILDAKQQSQYAEFERKRKQRKYESMVKGALAMIESEIPLTNVQREKLLKVILEQETRVLVDSISYYQIYLVLYQISKIPEDQIKPIFLENEWKAMQFMLNRVGGYEQILQREGLLEE